MPDWNTDMIQARSYNLLEIRLGDERAVIGPRISKNKDKGQRKNVSSTHSQWADSLLWHAACPSIEHKVYSSIAPGTESKIEGVIQAVTIYRQIRDENNEESSDA